VRTVNIKQIADAGSENIFDDAVLLHVFGVEHPCKLKLAAGGKHVQLKLFTANFRKLALFKTVFFLF